MRQIKIDIIDNGYVLSHIKVSALTNTPEAVVIYLKTIQEVTEHLLKL